MAYMLFWKDWDQTVWYAYGTLRHHPCTRVSTLCRVITLTVQVPTRLLNPNLSVKFHKDRK